MTKKHLILVFLLTLLLLASGCRMAAHLTNPDTYSRNRREPWEKRLEPKMPKPAANQL